MTTISSEHLFLATGGVTAVEITSLVEIPTSAEISEIIKIIIQILIGIVTIMGIFKKSPPSSNTNLK